MSASSVVEPIVYEAMPGRVVFAPGSLAGVPDEVSRLGKHRAVLVDGLPDASQATSVALSLGQSHALTLRVERQHVPAELVTPSIAATTTSGADCLVSLGGGSALGVAKAIAHETGLPIIAVPTTYAGSEMTPIWGITEDGHKDVGRDLTVLPRVVLYDPELTVGLPPQATAASGMNAVAHCVEALWTVHRNPVTDAIAGEAIVLLAAGLRASVLKPDDIEARSRALQGAWLAGKALAVGGTALHHKICHVLGGTFDLPHAEVHAAVLPWVVEQFRFAAPAALQRIAGALAADDAVAGLLALSSDLGANKSLADLGLTAAQADLAAKTIAASAPRSPAPVSVRDVRDILDRAMVGR